MLNLSSKNTYRTNDGITWQFFQEEGADNVFYVAPVPVLATDDKTGNYIFSLVEYDGDNASGYCAFTTQLDVPAGDLAEIKTYLKNTYPALTPDPTVLTGMFDLKAYFSYSGTKGYPSNLIEVTPSPFDNNMASFLVNLGPEAMSLFKSYFSGDAGAGRFSVSYQFMAPGRLPLIKVVSTLNSSVAYEYEKIHTVQYDT